MSTPMESPPATSQPDTLQTLMQMINSYMVTQMIYVAAKLNLADLVADGPKTSAELAEITAMHAPSLYRLLRALAGLGIFAEDEHGCFTLTPLADLLRSDAPQSVRGWAIFSGNWERWRVWEQLEYSVATGQTAFAHVWGMENWEYRAQHPEANRIFNEAMTARSTSRSAAVLDAYDFSGIQSLVDVGGGHGALIAAILKRHARLRGILFDLPHVVAGASPVLSTAGVADRCEVVGGNFLEAVPSGADAYILSKVIHDWGDADAVAILRSCHHAMGPHGKLLLIEAVIPTSNARHPGKLSDINMLVSNAGGRERTEREWRALLITAGFSLTRIIPTRDESSVIEAVPR